MLHLDLTNRSGALYSTAVMSQFRVLAKPFLNLLPGQKGFSYIKIIDNGTRLYLSTVEGWTTHYVNCGFQDDVNHLKHNIPEQDFKVSLWCGYEKDSILDSTVAFDVWHGFSIHERCDNYCEYFDFFTHKENYLFPTQCLNSLDKIKLLIKEFRVKAASIIDHTDSQKLIVSKKWIPFDQIWHSSIQTPSKCQELFKLLESSRNEN